MRLPPPKNSKPQPPPVAAAAVQPQQALTLPSSTTLAAPAAMQQQQQEYSAAQDLIPRGAHFAVQRITDASSSSSSQAAAAVFESAQAIVQLKQQATNQLATVLHQAAPKQHTNKFIKIHSEVNATSGQRTQERVVRLVERAQDPLEPAKFKFRAVPKAPGSPPVPVLHSPTKKASEEERAQWNIPMAISNWNNTKGFVVSLDKRLAQTEDLSASSAASNDRFAKLADSLFTAEDAARSMVEQRFTQRQQNEERKLQDENDRLRIAALEARAMRGGGGNKPRPVEEEDEEEGTTSRTDRDLVRAERKRELDREMRQQAAGRRTQHQREEERDISERIALGMPVAGGAAGAASAGGVEFDQRLYNRADASAGGLGSDLARAGDEEDNVYTTALFQQQQQRMDTKYRPSQTLMQAKSQEDLSRKLEALKGGSAGASSGGGGGGPVLFEKQEDAFRSSMAETSQRGTAFGMQSMGRFAADAAAARQPKQSNRRFEDKDDERELEQEYADKKQRERDIKKARIAFVSSSTSGGSNNGS